MDGAELAHRRGGRETPADRHAGVGYRHTHVDRRRLLRYTTITTTMTAGMMCITTIGTCIGTCIGIVVTAVDVTGAVEYVDGRDDGEGEFTAT